MTVELRTYRDPLLSRDTPTAERPWCTHCGWVSSVLMVVRDGVVCTVLPRDAKRPEQRRR